MLDTISFSLAVWFHHVLYSLLNLTKYIPEKEPCPLQKSMQDATHTTLTRALERGGGRFCPPLMFFGDIKKRTA